MEDTKDGLSRMNGDLRAKFTELLCQYSKWLASLQSAHEWNQHTREREATGKCRKLAAEIYRLLFGKGATRKELTCIGLRTDDVPTGGS